MNFPDPLHGGGTFGAPGSRAASLEADLKIAMRQRQIEIMFQPQYRLRDDSLYGAEALARWRHPQVGLIGAGDLFNIAERAGCVAELSQHIFERALAHTANWPLDMVLSLNATPEEICEPRFVEKLAAQVAWARRPTRSITVEITEDVLLADLDAAVDVTSRLKVLGFRVSLDDFGAGFCNFRYLKRLHLDALKLDRSMVEGVARDPRDLTILRGIVAMAKALSLSVVAEGIEQERQRSLIAAEGCDIYQGFLKAAPMAAETFQQIARR